MAGFDSLTPCTNSRRQFYPSIAAGLGDSDDLSAKPKTLNQALHVLDAAAPDEAIKK